MGYSQASEIPYAVVMERTFVHRVYAWMTGGLVVTALVALVTAATPAIQEPIKRSPFLLLGLIIGTFILVGALVAGISRMSPFAAGVCFVLYSAVNGLIFSLIFSIYTPGSISRVFFVAAATFGAMSVYGWVTKKDLTSIGNLCAMGVFGVLLSLVVNGLFLRSAGFDLIISCVGVLVFVGLTAYDTQRIKMMHNVGQDGTAADKKAAVIGALRLYLDFINLFLFLLRLMGRRR